MNKIGRFGNRLKSWDTLSAYLESGHIEKVALRSLLPGGKFQPWLTAAQVSQRFKPGEYVISEHAPDHALTIQGEIQRGCKYLDFFYSTVPNLPMRIGLARHGVHVDGLRALQLIQKNCDASSLDDIRELMDDFDAVIEFSCYSFTVGLCNRNTLIWDVRTSF